MFCKDRGATKGKINLRREAISRKKKKNRHGVQWRRWGGRGESGSGNHGSVCGRSTCGWRKRGGKRKKRNPEARGITKKNGCVVFIRGKEESKIEIMTRKERIFLLAARGGGESDGERFQRARNPKAYRAMKRGGGNP